jgi:hypothetical protein
MMIDIMTYGPITVSFDVYSNFFSYNAATDVYNQTSGSYAGGHAVKIIGWGSTAGGMPYWLVANSWAPRWGDQGYFKMLRGANLCGFEKYPTSGYAPSRPYVGARAMEERQTEEGDVIEMSLPIAIPGGYVTHTDLQSDDILNAADAAVVLINQMDTRQTQGTPVVLSASTSVAAGMHYDMTLVSGGRIYRVHMFQDLQGDFAFTEPPQVIGKVGGGGLTGGDVAAIVVCSVFGAALVVAAVAYAVTRRRDDASEDAELEESSRKNSGIPVMVASSHVRRVQAGEHQSVTARSEPQSK